MDHAATHVLDQFLPGRQWAVRRPQHGWRKPCFIADSDDCQYFVKFDVPVPLLKRLGEIGVAPRVLFSGEWDGLPFVIQEFIDGTYPEGRSWMRNNAPQLAAVINTYHHDRPLYGLLARTVPTDFHNHLQQDLAWLSGRLDAIDPALLPAAELHRDFKQLIDVAANLHSGPLTPVHNDPSPTNMLVSAERFVFIDWDEITLSDPMRDIGLILWWNFPPEGWPDFLTRCDLEFTPDRLAKIYWFAARASFDIALWHAENALDGSSFVEDLHAALKSQPNPKGY